MKTQRGFYLTLLTALSVAAMACPAGAQQPPPSQGMVAPAPSANVPLAAGFSQGWSQPGTAAPAMQAPPWSPGYPNAAMPAGFPISPAAFQGAPQPFPHAAPYPMGYEPQVAHMAGGEGEKAGGDAYYDGQFEYTDSCPACGGHGCEHCYGGYGGYGGVAGSLASGVVSNLNYWLMPYSEGGRCAPRWYDVTLDGMYVTREDVSRRVNFASEPASGAIVLSTDNLDFDEELGLRFTGAVEVYAGSVIEFTYFGLFNWADGHAEERATGTLFSAYSNFGQFPAVGVGFPQTDLSTRQRITYSSEVDNFELNFRKRFTGPGCRVQWSWLAGVRFLYLDEDFEYDTIGGDDPLTGPVEITGSQETDINTRNSLTGFQLGGDIWTVVTPGVSLGAELKAGVFGNYGNQTTRIRSVLNPNDPTPTVLDFAEPVDFNDISFVSEARLEFVYKTTPNWAFRAGYTLVYVDGIALAPENFNATPPNIFGSFGRVAQVNDNGDLFLHGGHAGFEWMW